MRVTPWSQYQLVGQETDPDLQLASGKNWLVRGCASFVCFGRSSAGPENPSPLKVGPTQSQEVSQEPLDFVGSEDQVLFGGPVDDNDSTREIISVKSSLKKSVNIAPVAGTVAAGAGGDGITNKHEALYEKDNAAACQMARRKVHWKDTTGEELLRFENLR